MLKTLGRESSRMMVPYLRVVVSFSINPITTSRIKSVSVSSKSREIERLLEDADSARIVALDATTLKQTLINFEKKINKV
jgi:hypothetical protein